MKVAADFDSAEAKRFSATTSGHAMLFDRGGRLRFSGGITDARGHEGDNDGRDAVVSIINGGDRMPAATPVFGCSLYDN